MKIKIKNNSGFTLIELMVAISIVAILATIGLVIYGDVQKKARDARRTQDIRSIAEALETNKPVGGITYIRPRNNMFAGGSIPKDPKTGTQEYCMWLNIPASGAPVVPPIPPANAAAVTSWTSCGGGPTSTGGSADLTAIEAATTEWTGAASWIICAKLEAVTNGVTCVSSKY